MTINNIILAGFILILLPVLIGNTTLGILKKENNILHCYLFGYISMWAMFEIVAVPFILLKMTFSSLVMVMSGIYVAYCGYGLCKKYMPKIKPVLPKEIDEWIMTIVMLLAVCFMVGASLFLQHTDADDSRFVVNAVDVYRTNRLLLTDVNTGREITTWIGDLNKDVTSPWAVYMAYLSKLTGIYPTIMMHTCMAPILTLLTCIVYGMLGELFFKNDRFHKAMFVCFVILLNIFGYYTTHTIQAVTMLRIWQGKATVAALGIPLLLWVLITLYNENKPMVDPSHNPEQTDQRKHRPINTYILLLILDIALCLPSAMGILIGGFMIGSYGLAYGIVKKNWKMLVALWSICLVNVMYIVVSYLM